MEKEFYVSTPAGYLHVFEYGGEEYPGVMVELTDVGAEEKHPYGQLLAIIEYTSSGENAEHIQTCVYDGESEGENASGDVPVVFRHNQFYIPTEDFKNDLRRVLAQSVSSDYVGQLLDNPEFYLAVKRDVEQTSGWEEEGQYNDDDIKLAIGRALMGKYGMEY